MTDQKLVLNICFVLFLLPLSHSNLESSDPCVLDCGSTQISSPPVAILCCAPRFGLLSFASSQWFPFLEFGGVSCVGRTHCMVFDPQPPTGISAFPGQCLAGVCLFPDGMC